MTVLIAMLLAGAASGLLVAGIQIGSTVLIVAAVVIYALALGALAAAMRTLRQRQ